MVLFKQEYVAPYKYFKPKYQKTDFPFVFADN